MQDFGNIVRTLLALKNCSLDEAKKLAKEPETKREVEHLRKTITSLDSSVLAAEVWSE